MNWYKIAKLADKVEDPNKSIFVRCMYCQKLLTDPEGIYREQDREDLSRWKSNTELDPEEIKEFEYADEADLESTSGISDGMCPICFKALMDKMKKQ